MVCLGSDGSVTQVWWCRGESFFMSVVWSSVVVYALFHLSILFIRPGQSVVVFMHIAYSS